MYSGLVRACLVAGALLLGFSGPRVAAQSQPGSPAVPVVVEVQMLSHGGTFSFEPAGLLIQPGDTVRFVSVNDSHTVTAYGRRIPQDAVFFNSLDTVGGLLRPGESFELMLTVPGTYDYFCIPHERLGMKGTIVVGQPGGPGDEINDGEPTSQEVLAAQGQ